MRIRDVKAVTLRIPLEQPIQVSNLVIRDRDYVFVEIETENGLKGHGFGLARNGLVSESIERNLKPLLIGQDALYTEKLWQDMYMGTRYLGRKGLMMRAISAVDIALWDMKGKRAQLPLWQLLGGMNPSVPAFVAGGYYRENEKLPDLHEEFSKYREQGFQGVKMNLGGAPLRHDLERVETVRKAIGADTKLMVDFNGALTSAKEALHIANQLAPYQIAFIEEPFLMDRLAAMRELRKNTVIPIAIGEDESGRWAFKELIAQETLDILRHDATLVGGISEWIKVAHMGLAYDLPIFPHWFPELHIHLAASCVNGMGVELIAPEANIMNFHKLMHNPVTQRDGYALAPSEPGLGIDWDWGMLESSIYKGGV